MAARDQHCTDLPSIVVVEAYPLIGLPYYIYIYLIFRGVDPKTDNSANKLIHKATEQEALTPFRRQGRALARPNWPQAMHREQGPVFPAHPCGLRSFHLFRPLRAKEPKGFKRDPHPHRP